MRKINVKVSGKSYEVHIGAGLLETAGMKIKELGFSGKLAVITNQNIGKIYNTDVLGSLESAGFLVNIFEVPDGERFKSLSVAGKLYSILSRCRAERSTPIIAVGGGVIGDLAGFVAATYLRGVPLIQMPTTLLAVVDSSIGGKVAVNHGRLKNMVGAFYQPRAVISDISTLKTLPPSELDNGLAEVIKYGAIRDKGLFGMVENNMERLKSLDEEFLENVALRSVAIKAEVVEKDEIDLGIRNILNFGHTVGHALETVSNFKIGHGKAVAIGMAAAALISNKFGFLSDIEVARLTDMLMKAGLPTKLQGFSREKILRAMSYDKKVASGKLKFVLLRSIGEAIVVDEVQIPLIEEVLKNLNADS